MNPSEGLVCRAISTVPIIDNDKGLAFEFSQYRVREDEGSVLIGLVRADDGDFPVSVTVATQDGTAQAGQDYAAVTTVLTFPPGHARSIAHGADSQRRGARAQ